MASSPSAKRARRDEDVEDKRGTSDRRSRRDDRDDRNARGSSDEKRRPHSPRREYKDRSSSRDERRRSPPRESPRERRRHSSPQELRSSREERPAMGSRYSRDRPPKSLIDGDEALEESKLDQRDVKQEKPVKVEESNGQVESTEGQQTTTEEVAPSILRMQEAEAALEANEKAKQKKEANYEYSGALAAETNNVNGIPLVYAEPTEARKPSVHWRLYVFKGDEPLEKPLLLHRQSCYLFGRERKVVDIPTDHPSCSKQHAVIQHRLVEKVNPEEETTSRKIRPYLMDLGSTNGTFLNGERVEPQRYYELFEKDTIKFGNSSREYVLLHADSA